ncbi:MAG: hypothetical protein IK078_09320 [Lachnospiraceae bacterium]|nr:hypothetical protein [Lachnospiraceae bacterium]
MNGNRNQKDLVEVRIRANDSYQIKRALEAVEKEKGFVMMSRSGIKKNTGNGARFREFASFRDQKAERKMKKANNGEKKGGRQ